LCQITPSNQGIPRKKAWISLDSFGRFWAFQWVTANPNKKNLSLFQPGAERLKPSSAQAFCSGAGVFLPVGKDIAHILVNEKKLHEKL
jgi:hypothetical protein